MAALSSNEDVTKSLETILATGRYCDGPPVRSQMSIQHSQERT